MKKLSLLFLPLLIFLISANNPKQNTSDPESITNNNNAFAIELYQQVKSKKDNIFFSPFSISTALAMTYAGAATGTELEMAKTLHFDPNTKNFHSAYKIYLEKIKANYSDGVTLNIANKLWGQKDFPFVANFMNTTKEYYDATSENLDFIGKTEESRQTINKWIEAETNNKIQNLLAPGMISIKTKLVLTNAIYFKGTWENKFDKKNTLEQEFKKNDGTIVKAPFMNQTIKTSYIENNTLTAVRLSYKGYKQSMIIFLPKETVGFEKMEKEFTAENYNQWRKTFKACEAVLSIPKFKTDFAIQLSDQLRMMGMKNAFSDNADFSRMSKTGIHISNVIHKAFVEVNEEGTEAAAATAVIMAQNRAVIERDPIIQFTADHPFLYMITDNSTGSILFMGTIMDPTK